MLITVEATVANEIRLRALAVARGQLVLDPLDAHRDQCRARIGALLAVLDDRDCINVDDWTLAGMIMDTSDAVRRWVLETNTAAADQLEDARTSAAIKRQRLAAKALENDVHARAVDRGARAMGRLAHRQAGEAATTRDLSRAVAGRDREQATIDEMIALGGVDGVDPAGRRRVGRGEVGARMSVGHVGLSDMSDRPTDPHARVVPESVTNVCLPGVSRFGAEAESRRNAHPRVGPSDMSDISGEAR